MKHLVRGVSLVELLIAMTIGIFLLGAIGSVYLSSKESYRTSDIVSRLQENARLALHLVATDIEMAGFLGNSSNPTLVERQAGAPSELPATLETPGAVQDCAVRWYIDMTSLLVIGNDGAPTLNGASFSGSCLSTVALHPGTDVVALKRAASAEAADLSRHINWTLLRTDPMRGSFFLGGETPPDLPDDVSTTRRWLAHVYYIAAENADAIPGLRRITLGGGPRMNNSGELIPGIQDLQVQLGVDTDGDGAPNQFVEPDATGALPPVAARIWVLAQADTPDLSHDDSINEYRYANKIYRPGDASSDNATETVANPKQYRRLLLSKTVPLRNL